MANEDFIFRLGADISQFTKSITEVEAELKSTRNTLKTQTGAAIVQTNKYIQDLEQSLVSLKKVGLDKLPQASNNGATALFSLSQVARDAPFGFIAIQNNLPMVIDQFSMLSKTSGGLTGALKSVGSALIGPAGISFAFGAVIAGITALVQQYGSLGSAFDAIIGSQKQLTKEQKEFAKNLASESTEIVTLATLFPKYNDNKSEQVKIIKKLNDLSPTYFGNLKAEKTSIDDITASLDKYIDSFIGKIYIESQQKRINELFTKYAEQITKIVDTENARKNTIKDTRSNIQGLEKDNTKYFNSIINNAKRAQTGDISIGLKIVPTKTTIQDAIDTLKSELKNKLTGVFGEIDLFKQFINIDDIAKTTTKSIKEVSGAWLGFAPQAVIAGDDFNKVLEKNAKEAKNLEGWRNIILQIAQAYDATSNSIGNAQIYLKSFGKITDQVNATFEAMFQNMQNADMLFGLDILQNKINKTFEKIGQDVKDSVQLQKQEYQKVQGYIENFISAPLDYLANTILEKGKFSWQEFGKVVLRTLAGILASIVTTTIAATLANAIVPGAGTAGVNAYNQASKIFGNKGGSISPSLGYTPRGLGGSANFSGIQGGGMALSGNVVMVQRGSDLVGVLSRTNISINKVG